MTIFFVIIGLMMFVFGLMSEIMMKTYYGVHVDMPYNIKMICEDGEEELFEKQKHFEHSRRTEDKSA